VPECKDKIVVLLDPMAATGVSLADAIAFVKKHNPKKIIPGLRDAGDRAYNTPE